MRALVTGGAGFIGSHTVDLLLREGLEVRILDSLTPPVHLNGKKPSYLPKDVQFILGEVTDQNVMNKALKGIDVVLHLAAYQDYLPDFSKFFRVNTVSTSLIYEIIVTNKLPVHKVIIASSQTVYGEGKYRCSCSFVVRLLRDLGWEPSSSIDEIAEEYISWVESQGTAKDYYAEAERLMRKMNVLRLSK